jgi:L-ascorbate metabolism protein UlaG (beta-lactamase superfamily)
MAPLAAITSRFPQIDVAFLFAGAARLVSKNNGNPLTLTSQRAADAAVFLGASRVVPAHYEGWSIYSENAADILRAFDEVGISQRLQMTPAGTWTLIAATAETSRPGLL